jgi:RNA polymerase sigma-70 factor (ECF subfamily)
MYIKRLGAGDEAAFDMIYQLTYRKIYFLVLPILRDKALAEDIMQDTYLKFLEKLYSYKAKNSLAYILTIARNLAINEYNKVEDEDINLFSFDEYLEISVENKDLITKALSVLNEFERNVFLLHELENLKHREIAVILNKPIGTITWTYQQAIKKMRAHLDGMI